MKCIDCGAEVLAVVDGRCAVCNKIPREKPVKKPKPVKIPKDKLTRRQLADLRRDIALQYWKDVKEGKRKRPREMRKKPEWVLEKRRKDRLFKARVEITKGGKL